MKKRILIIIILLTLIFSTNALNKIEALKKAREYIVENCDEIDYVWQLRPRNFYYDKYLESGKFKKGLKICFYTYFKNYTSFTNKYIVFFDNKGKIINYDFFKIDHQNLEINIVYTREEARLKTKEFFDNFYEKYYKKKNPFSFPSFKEIQSHYSKIMYNNFLGFWIEDLKRPVIYKQWARFYLNFYYNYYDKDILKFKKNVNYVDVIDKSWSGNFPRLCWLIPLDFNEHYLFIDCETCEIITGDISTRRLLGFPVKVFF